MKYPYIPPTSSYEDKVSLEQKKMRHKEQLAKELARELIEKQPTSTWFEIMSMARSVIKLGYRLPR